MISTAAAAVLAMLLVGEAHSWQNKMKKDMPAFECPYGETLSNFRTTLHHPSEKGDDYDRRWDFDCRPSEIGVSDDCSWEDLGYPWENKNDEFVCPNNGVMTGLESQVWDSKHRYWRAKCCKSAAHTFFDCKWTEVKFQYKVDNQDLIMGLRKIYNDGGFSGYNGHKYKYLMRACKGATCEVSSIKVLEELGVVKTSRKLVGMATSYNCGDNVEAEFAEGTVEGLEEGVEITTSKANGWSLGASLSIETSFSVGAGPKKAVGGLGYTVSRSWSGESSQAETAGTTKAYASSTSSAIEYSGPKAAMSVSEVDEYQMSKSDVQAEYKVKCTNGMEYNDIKPMGLDVTTFGKTHFRVRIATFANKTACVDARPHVESCIKRMNVGTATGHKDIINQYESCFVVNGVKVATIGL